MKVNCEAGDENCQVKVNPGERGKTESDRKQIKSFHEETIQRSYKVKRVTRLTPVAFVTSLTSLIICAMLDIRLIREKPDFVRERLATRGGGDEAKIDDVLRVDVERRQTETALQQLNADRKRLSKEIGGKKSRGEPTDELEQRVRGFGEEIGDLNAQATAAEEKQNDLLLRIANLPHESVPIGKDAGANRVVRTWGEKPRVNQTGRSCRTRHETKSLRHGTRRKTERQRFYLFHRCGREAGARADQFHDRFAHAGAWLHRNQSAVSGSARLYGRHVAASEV